LATQKKESKGSGEGASIPRPSEDARRAQVAAGLAQMKAAGFKFETSRRRH
jgi:hypothetical protein